jgi:thiol-disulfide isomerase/thioredoxin
MTSIDADKSGKTRLSKWVGTVSLYAVIFVVSSFLGNLWLTRNQAHDTAPQIVGLDLEANEIQIKYEQYNKPVILYFFADWCPICKFQHPVISSLDEDYPVISIAMQSGSNQQLKQYLEQHELSLSVINDSDGIISSSFGVQGVPAMFVIQQDAKIAFSTRGYTSEIGLLIRLWLSQIL